MRGIAHCGLCLPCDGKKGRAYYNLIFPAMLSRLTKTAMSLGALGMVPVGESDLEICSNVTAVGWILPERRMTAKPWEPWKAQQFPG